MTKPTTPKRSVQHYNGLKVLLMAGGLTATLIGSGLIGAQQHPMSVAAEAAPAQPTITGPGFDPSALKPIPTAIQPRLELPTPQPTVVAEGGGNPPMPQTGGQAAAPQSGSASSANAGFVMPQIVSVGSLPPLPSIPSGGGGGNQGGGGGGGRTS